MNSVLSRTTNIRLKHFEDSVVSDYELYTPVEIEDEYATVPMQAVCHGFVREDEEELHTSFEAALSGRLEHLNERLSRLSNPAMNNIAAPSTEPLTSDQSEHSFLSPEMRQRILLGSFGIMCMVAGFDLMGLLMLHAH